MNGDNSTGIEIAIVMKNGQTDWVRKMESFTNWLGEKDQFEKRKYNVRFYTLFSAVLNK